MKKTAVGGREMCAEERRSKKRAHTAERCSLFHEQQFDVATELKVAVEDSLAH